MRALLNRAIQRFVTDIYGAEMWSEITSTAALGFESFEPLLEYDPTVTDSVINAAVFELDRPRSDFLEDLGQYLVSHPSSESIRRLLRFGGATFPAFLDSLEDLPDRARLALPDRRFPRLSIHQLSGCSFVLMVDGDLDGLGHVMIGAIRGMADDYGCLITMEHRGRFRGAERMSIDVHELGHAAARTFQLAGPVVT
jgi:hypothetical protein